MKHIRFVPLSIVALGLAMTGPVFAQDSGDEAAAQEVPQDAAASDGTAADTPADAGADATADTTSDQSYESGAATGTSEPVADDTASSEEAEPSAPPRKPYYVYAGADYAFLTTSLSKESLKNALGGDDFDSSFYRLRVGTRLFKQIGVEAQFGIKDENGNSTDKVETKQMYGLYLVPTGNLFRFLEVSAPIGYSHLKLKNSNGGVKFDAVSFGLNFEVPVYVNPDNRLPDIRIGGGGTVFYAERAARTYGYHAGIRFDFKI